MFSEEKRLTLDPLEDAPPVKDLTTAGDGDGSDDLQLGDGTHQTQLVILL